MPVLTRRRGNDPHRKTWHVYYGDVRVGMIGGTLWRSAAPKVLDWIRCRQPLGCTMRFFSRRPSIKPAHP